MLNFEVYFRQILTSGIRIDKAVEIHEANDFKSVQEIIDKRLRFFEESMGCKFEYFINKVYESENSFHVDNPILLQTNGVFEDVSETVNIESPTSYEDLKDEKNLSKINVDEESNETSVVEPLSVRKKNKK
jgi:hypothetical protein